MFSTYQVWQPAVSFVQYGTSLKKVMLMSEKHWANMLIIVYYYYVGSCGKLLKDMDAAEFHAAKTGHANFAESTEEKKPLTAEEKEEQKAKLAMFLSPVLYACTPSASLEHMRSTVKILVSAT